MDYRADVRRLRKLALVALAAYDLPPLRLKLITHLFNTTFRVDTESGSYVLHIYRSNTPTTVGVGAELEWLLAIRRDTDLQVPDPVRTRSGDYITLAATSDTGEPHICTLFGWLDGRRVIGGLTARHMELVGTAIARLHDHAASFGPPPHFPRIRVDALSGAGRVLPDPFTQEVIDGHLALVAKALSLAEADRVAAIISRIMAAEDALGRGPDAFGLIHADMHQYNVLFWRGDVRVLDFGDCGFGPLLYDMAVPLAMLYWRANYPALREGLLTGYKRMRQLSPEHETLLDTFIALRHLQDALWVLDDREHPAVGPDWATRAREILEAAAKCAAISET